MKGFPKIAIYGAIAALLLIAALWLRPHAGAVECLAGFDLGSTGVRVASNDPDAIPTREKFDYFGDVEADKQFEPGTITKTIQFFKDLPAKAKIRQDCKIVAGGFSAWRYAIDGDKKKLVNQLGDIWSENGKKIPVYVIPIRVEGIYGYRAAQEKGLKTPLTWDIGGGSMQIAKEDDAWGDDHLGQKAWRKLFCNEVRGVKDSACIPNPISTEERSKTKTVLNPYVKKAVSKLNEWNVDHNITAISAPVVATMYPILRCLKNKKEIDGSVDANGFNLQVLSEAIDKLTEKSDSEISDRIDEKIEGCKKPDPQFIATSVTDMLLVQAFMEGLSIDRVEVLPGVEIDNAKGLIADANAFAWAGHYDCYLDRLEGMQGMAAYESDPAGCQQ